MKAALGAVFAAGCLAACSNLSCDLPNDVSAVPLGARAQAIRSSIQVTPALESGADPETVGSIPSNSGGLRSESTGRLPSQFSLRDRKLFSTSEDARPWPLAGTPEAKRQDDEDQQREREISRVVKICHC